MPPLGSVGPGWFPGLGRARMVPWARSGLDGSKGSVQLDGSLGSVGAGSLPWARSGLDCSKGSVGPGWLQGPGWVRAAYFRTLLPESAQSASRRYHRQTVAKVPCPIRCHVAISGAWKSLKLCDQQRDVDTHRTSDTSRHGKAALCGITLPTVWLHYCQR